MQTEENEPRRRRYSSASIKERRTRVLKAARDLIVKRGVGAFSMNEVSRRAKVSEATLYNIVGTRNNLIALAVDQYQQGLSDLAHVSPMDEIEEVLASLFAICDQLILDRHWGRAIAELYFSPETDDATYASLRGVARTHLVPSLRIYKQKGQLITAIPIDLSLHHFSNTAYSLLQDWAVGRISDKDFPTHIAVALLTTLSFVVRGSAHDRLQALTQQLAVRL